MAALMGWLSSTNYDSKEKHKQRNKRVRQQRKQPTAAVLIGWLSSTSCGRQHGTPQG